jgi:hypothetical protein
VESPSDFNECVSKDKLTRLHYDQRTYINEKFEEMMKTVNNMITRIEQRPSARRPRHQPPMGEEEEDDDVGLDAYRLQCNRHGMGGNHNLKECLL